MSRHKEIENQAIDWLIRRDEPGWTESDQTELTAWIQQSMSNRAAFLRVEYGWSAADRICAIGEGTNDTNSSSGRGVDWWATAIAASVAIAVGIASFWWNRPEPVQQARYDTPRGGRELVSLSDGSIIELNTESAVRTVINDKSRDVWLDSGEAYFEVAHRDGKSFIVHAGSQTITVLGTKFTVRRDKDRVTVNVVEGRVRVEEGQGGGHAGAAIVTGGDTVFSRAGSTLIAPKSQDRVERALAWRHGMLTFNLIPLSEVVNEFNRYNRVQLSVDPSVAEIPIGGSFRASSAEAFTRLLRDAYGLRVEQTGEHIKIFD